MTELTLNEQAHPLTRREFLTYLWSASMALALAGSSGAVLWYAYPRFRAGEFGGKFPMEVSKLPTVGSDPEPHPEGRYWLVNLESGVLALYTVCVHLGCLYRWVANNNRFECPCHGSKYARDGTRLEPPAPRNLDRFIIRALDKDGEVLAETQPGDANKDSAAGGPLKIPPGTTILEIDTSHRIKGANAKT